MVEIENDTKNCELLIQRNRGRNKVKITKRYKKCGIEEALNAMTEKQSEERDRLFTLLF